MNAAQHIAIYIFVIIIENAAQIRHGQFVWYKIYYLYMCVIGKKISPLLRLLWMDADYVYITYIWIYAYIYTLLYTFAI